MSALGQTSGPINVTAQDAINSVNQRLLWRLKEKGGDCDPHSRMTQNCVRATQKYGMSMGQNVNSKQVRRACMSYNNLSCGTYRVPWTQPREYSWPYYWIEPYQTLDWQRRDSYWRHVYRDNSPLLMRAPSYSVQRNRTIASSDICDTDYCVDENHALTSAAPESALSVVSL